MCQDAKTSKAILTGRVVFNQPIGPCFYKIRVGFEDSANDIISQSCPGQFCEFSVAGLSRPNDDQPTRNIIFRRPLSFCDVDMAESGSYYADILYCVLGEGTKRLSTLAENDVVDIIAPLGNGFSINPEDQNALLVAGGMGAPPLQYLAKNINSDHSQQEIFAFIGAQTVKGLPFFHTHQQIQNGKEVSEISEFSRFNAKTFIATDDGSAGTKGFVTEILEKFITEKGIDCKKTTIYTCGPEAMAKAVAEVAAKYKIKCQVSLERLMGCGIGLCQSCAVECKDSKDTAGSVYKLCCKDGPVFDASEVVW